MAWFLLFPSYLRNLRMETWIGDDGQFQWNDNVHRVLGSGQGPKRPWFAAKNSPPPRLVCGSPEDNITPVELLEKLAARIGCEKKLDFEELVWHCNLTMTEITSPWMMIGEVMPFLKKKIWFWKFLGWESTSMAAGRSCVRSGRCEVFAFHQRLAEEVSTWWAPEHGQVFWTRLYKCICRCIYQNTWLIS